MEVKILNYEKTMLEFEMTGADTTIPELIANKLSDNSSVEFVSYKVSHPVIGHPRIIVKTKSKDALELTLEAIDEIKAEVSEFRKAFKKSK